MSVQRRLVAGIEEGRPQRPCEGSRRLEAAVVQAQRNGGRSIEDPSLAVVHGDLEAGPRVRGTGRASIDAVDRMHRPNPGRQSGVVHRHVRLTAHQVGVHRARSGPPRQADVKRSIIRDLLPRRALHGPEAQVLGHRGENEIGLDHLARRAELQGITTDLHEIRQGVDCESTSAKGKVLPPRIGRKGATAVFPQSGGIQAMGLAVEWRRVRGQGRTSQKGNLGWTRNNSREQQGKQEKAHRSVLKVRCAPSKVTDRPDEICQRPVAQASAMAAMPGRVLPSRPSNMAPPPVET